MMPLSRLLVRPTAAALLAAMAFPLQAQPQAPQGGGSDSITVHGRKLSEEAARQEALDFLRNTGVAGGMRPAARWEEPVCLLIVGLEPHHASKVEAKMAEIAGGAGIRIARDPCRANVAVTFTADAGAFVRAVEDRDWRRLSEVPSGARDALRDGAAPLRWWYSTKVESRDGTSAGTDSPGFAFGNAEGGGPNIPVGAGGVLLQYNSSLVSTQAVRALKSATVVVDVGLAEGTTLDAVASYAAFVAFAEIRSGADPDPRSILGLFADAAGPTELTDRDRIFLRALYRLPLDREARAQRRMLVRDLLDGATGGGSDAAPAER